MKIWFWKSNQLPSCVALWTNCSANSMCCRKKYFWAAQLQLELLYEWIICIIEDDLTGCRTRKTSSGALRTNHSANSMCCWWRFSMPLILSEKWALPSDDILGRHSATLFFGTWVAFCWIILIKNESNCFYMHGFYLMLCTVILRHLFRFEVTSRLNSWRLPCSSFFVTQLQT